jgi:hypothetical protein
MRDFMRGKILFVCSLIAFMAIAFFASPALADTGGINTVTGQVTDSTGATLPGATVSLVDGSYLEIARTISDSNGAFTFQNADDRGTGYVKVIVSYVQGGKAYNLTKMPATWYSVNASLINISSEETSLASYPPLPESTRPQQVFTVVGQVTDANGNPLPGAEVHLYDGIYNEIAVTTNDENGNFSFSNVAAAAPGCKIQVFYRTNGRVYQTFLQNTLWYPTDSGLVKINEGDARLYDYPESKTGYIWGIITNSSAYPVSGDVHLTNGKKHLSLKTSESGNIRGFVFEVPVGEYTAYAVYKDADGSMESKPVKVQVNPSRNYLDYPSLTMVVDQPVLPEDLKPVAMAAAIVLAMALICGLWFGLRKL